MNIQDIVDELAIALGRSVVINDLNHRPVAASAQGEVFDDIRLQTLLQRRTPPEARQPVAVDLSPLGGLERLAIPIRDEGGPLSILWLITGSLPPLTAAHYAAIDAAVLLVREELSCRLPADDSSARSAVLGRLLADDPTIAHRAFKDAVTNLWLERGAGTLAVAVMLDSRSGAVERVA
ncbi:MAG: hypothetical protein Q7T71_10425, partial [Herbiconiux sp.]|nr:hypothetical protein [Herbiconiux sp.]